MFAKIVVDEKTPMIPDSQPRRFQFSMATMLIVVSGLSVVLSLTVWQPLFGGMASSLIVGTWWTHAAVRADHRRLAYYLAAWPMGTVASMVGCWPVLAGLLFDDAFPRESSLLYPVGLGIMCLAYLLAVLILRRKIRNLRSLVTMGIFSVYLTAALFIVLGCFWGVAVDVARGQFVVLQLLTDLPILIGAVFLSMVWATIVAPVAFPIGVAFCKILQRIDPEKIGQDYTDQTILRIVDIWQAVKEGPLDIEQIAERMDTDWQTAATYLKALCDLGILEYKKETGYCRKADPSSDAAGLAACKAATDTLQ